MTRVLATISALIERYSRRIAGLSVALLLAAYAAAAFLPVYVDEIGWRQVTRAAVDGGFDMEGSDNCGPNIYARPPWFMMPARWFSTAVNQTFPAPVFVRLAGVLCALIWLVLLLRLIARLFPDPGARARQAVLACSLLTLGLLPFMMVMSRPEQPMLLFAITVVSLALRPPVERIGQAWLRGGAMLVLAALVASYHPKGVLYAGLALPGILVSARGRATLAPRLVCMAAGVALVAVAFRYWSHRFACPNDPVIADLLARANIAGLWSRGQGHLDLAYQLLTGLNPITYVRLTIPADAMMMSQWVPAGLFPQGAVAVLGGAMKVAWGMAIVLTQIHVLRLVLSHRLALLRDSRFLLATAITGCVIIWGCSQIERNVYEAAHMLPMIVMALLLFNALPAAEPPSWSGLERALPLGLASLAGASLGFVLWHVGPALRTAYLSPGYIAAQPFSTSITGYARITQDIDAAMAAAGFPRDRQLRHVLIDGTTYLHLQRTFQPFERQAVLGPTNGTITDPLGYLRSRGSDGVVVGCRYLPPAMLALASRSGEVCAIWLGSR